LRKFKREIEKGRIKIIGCNPLKSKRGPPQKHEAKKGKGAWAHLACSTNPARRVEARTLTNQWRKEEVAVKHLQKERPSFFQWGRPKGNMLHDLNEKVVHPASQPATKGEYLKLRKGSGRGQLPFRVVNVGEGGKNFPKKALV